MATRKTSAQLRRDNAVEVFMKSPEFDRLMTTVRSEAVEAYKVSDDNAARQAARTKRIDDEDEAATARLAKKAEAEEAKRAIEKAAIDRRIEVLDLLYGVAKSGEGEKARVDAALGYLEFTDAPLRMGPFGPYRMRHM